MHLVFVESGTFNAYISHFLQVFIRKELSTIKSLGHWLTHNLLYSNIEPSLQKEQIKGSLMKDCQMLILLKVSGVPKSWNLLVSSSIMYIMFGLAGFNVITVNP